MLMTALLASSRLKEASACDRSLYRTSTNMICEDATCVETNTFLLNVESGMKICFNGEGTSSFSLRLVHYKSVATYNYIYKTSSYEIKTKTLSACKGADKCWKGNCKKFERHAIFKENNKNTVYGYGCDFVNAYSGVCFHEYLCTWYQWYVTLKGEKFMFTN